MIINGFCQKIVRAKSQLRTQTSQSPPTQRQRHVLNCLPEREKSTAALPAAATWAGNTQHLSTWYLGSWFSQHMSKESVSQVMVSKSQEVPLSYLHFILNIYISNCFIWPSTTKHFHEARVAKGSVPCGFLPWRGARVYQGAQASVVTAHARPQLVTAQLRPRQRCQEGEYAKRHKCTSCLNSAGATGHCLRRDKVPHPAAPGSAVPPGSCQCFGSGAQPAWHHEGLAPLRQPATQGAQELTGTQGRARFGGYWPLIKIAGLAELLLGFQMQVYCMKVVI